MLISKKKNTVIFVLIFTLLLSQMAIGNSEVLAVTSHPYLLYGTTDIQSIRDKWDTAPYSSEYAAQEAIADLYTITQLDSAASTIKPWGSLSLTVTAPANAAKMIPEIRLAGQGSVWIDSADAENSDYGLAATVGNSGFEDGTTWPTGWSRNTYAGNPQFVYDSTAAYSGVKSVNMTNDSSDDIGGWQSATEIPAIPGQHYTFAARFKMDSYVSTGGGVYLYIRWKDSSGNYLNATNDVQGSTRNEITTSPWLSLFAFSQCAANVYLKTNDTVYANKAKKALMYMLQNVKDRMDYLITNNIEAKSPYAAVHVGRGMAGWSIVYDMIHDSGVISSQEDNTIRTNLYWIADAMMNTNYFDYTVVGKRKNNFNSDRASGLGIFAITFPEYANASAYLTHALEELDFILSNNVGPDGDWLETTRYHAAVLSRIIMFSKALYRYDGTNLFADPNLKKMFDFLTKIQTPRDAVSSVKVDGSDIAFTPSVGDSDWGEYPFEVLGFAAGEYAVSDPELSKNMMAVYNRGGKYEKNGYSAFDYPLKQLLYINGSTAASLLPQSSAKYSGVGYGIFRQDFNQSGEDYLIINSSNDARYHRHNDEGSFSIYADSTPILLDSGISGYNSSTMWYRASIAHNMVQFKDSGGVLTNGPLTSSFGDFFTSNMLDYTRVDIPDKKASEYKRHVAFVKGGFDAYVVWDFITSTNPSRFNLHTLSTSTAINGSSFVSNGYNNMRLQGEILLPSSAVINKTLGGVSGAYPQNHQEYIYTEANAGDDYLAILKPRKNSEANLAVTGLTVGNSNTKAYKAQKNDGSYFIILINTSAQSQNTAISTNDSLTDMRTGASFTSASGQTSVTIEAKSIKLLTKKMDVYTVQAEADAFVRGGTYANTNYGSAEDLMIKTVAGANDYREGYIRFNLANIPANIVGARLRLRVNEAGESGITNRAAFVSNDSWSELTVTNSNKPTAGSPFAMWSVHDGGEVIEVDVTQQVVTEIAGDKKLSLKIDSLMNYGGPGYVKYDTRETSSGMIPELQIFTGGAIADDNFNNDTTGNAPAGWTLATAGGTVTVQEVPSASDKSMMINKTAAANLVRAAKVLPTAVSGLKTVEFKARVGDTVYNKNAPYILSSSSAAAVSIQFNSNGYIKAYNGSTFQNVQTYAADTWYDFKIVLNTDTDKFDLYINGSPALTQADFRNAADDISQVRFYLDSNQLGNMYIDNFKIY
jgi:hypothetical protein